MKYFTVLLSLAALSACSPNEKAGSATSGENIITANDFESVAGWGVDPTVLDRGRAHSGQYALIVDQQREFSLAFDMALGQASPTRIKTVRLDAWAYLPNENAAGMLVLQTMDIATMQQLFNDGIKLGEEVKTYSEWVPISKVITLPDDITAMQHIRLSLWRAGATDFVLIDDVKLSIVN